MQLGGCKKIQKKRKQGSKTKEEGLNIIIWAFLFYYLSLFLQNNMCLPTWITIKLLLPLSTNLGTRLDVSINNNSKWEKGHFSHLLMVFVL
jgi:hypothetical protein